VRGGPVVAYGAAAAACGAAVTVVEFAALRRLAPWYGQSVFTWANDVGVVLLSLAVGSVLGGALADRARSTVPFYRSLQWGAFWLVLAATAGSWLVPDLLPPDLAEERGALPIGFWESLAASALSFGPPMVALGMVGPFYVRRATRAGNVGRAAGWISAAGTAGSLLGCYLAPFWLLQDLGTRTTLLLSAAVVAAVVLWGYLFDRRTMPQALPATEPEPSAPGTSSLRASHLAVAFAAGLVVLVVEFAAVRLFAPWFGQSNPVWANAVGVVLLALAIGYVLGGRVADRTATERPLFALLSVAALLLVVVGIVGPSLAAWLAPTDLLADRALPLSFWGSLAATAVLVGPPIVCLGAVAPLVVSRESSPGRRGRAAGRVFAAGTVGSLVGTFLAPLVLLGGIGSRRTLFLCAGALGAAAALGGYRSTPRPRWGGAVGATALVVAVAAWAIVDPTLRRDPGQIVEVETPYQTVRVAEVLLEPPPVRARTRFLRFDEDVSSYQSVLLLEDSSDEVAKDALTAERYYEHLALGAWFSGMPWTATPPAAPRVLVVGYAGGTLHRVLDAVAPEGLEATVLGIEIDPEVTAIARRHLRLADLETPRLTLLADEDGRAVVEALPKEARYDLILVDAYQRTQYVPFHVTTEEFFRACASRLAPGGAIGMNVMSEEGMSSRLVRSIAATLLEGLAADGRAATFLVPNVSYPGNVAIWGVRGEAPRVAGEAPRSLVAATFALEALLVRHTAADGGLVLTDDRAPTEGLADVSLFSAPSEGGS
jgi:spermidine synthase